MPRGALVFIAALSCLAGTLANSCNCNLAADRSANNPATLNANLNNQDAIITRLEARYQAIQTKYEASLNRLSESKALAEQLSDEVFRLAPSPCNRAAGDVQCLRSGECVSSLLVNDGVDDCIDGTDEAPKVTEVPFSVGDSYTGRLPGGHSCFADGYATKVTAYIKEITTKDYFREPDVKTRITYEAKGDDGSVTTRAFNLQGFYNNGNGKLYQHSVDDDESNFGYVAQFGYYASARNPTTFFLGEIEHECGSVYFHPDK